MAFLGDLLIRMRADTADFQSDMGKASHVAEKHMRKISSLAANMGLALGVGGFGFFVKRMIDAQDELAKMSQKVGISVETLAGFGHAADLAGVSAEAMAKGLKSISTQMFDASVGLLESKRNFSALGIEIKKADGTLKSAETVMIEVADKFAAMQDGTTKTALAVKLFGRAGMDMIPMLNAGSAALAQMVAEGRELNPVTAESAHQAEVFNDNMLRLSGTIKGAFISSMNKALPALAEMSEGMVRARNSGHSIWGVMNEGAKLFYATLGTIIPGTAALAERAFNRLNALGKGLREGEVEGKIGGLPSDKPKKFTPKLVDDVAVRKAEAEAKKAKAEEDRMRKLDAAGWVAHIEAKTAAYEEWLLAKAAMDDDANNKEKADRALMMQQVFEEIDAKRDREIKAAQDYLNDVESTAKKANEIGKELGLTFSSAFEDAILKGAEFRDVLKGIAQDILRIIARKTVTEPIAAGISGWIGSLFGGARADGGPVMAGSSYLVGERGPEIFTAGASGMITPNGGGAGMTLNYAPIFNIDSRTDSATIARTVEAATRQSEARLIAQINGASGPMYNAVRRA